MFFFPPSDVQLFDRFSSLRSAPPSCARFVFSPLFCPRSPRPAGNAAPVNVQFVDAEKSSGSFEAVRFLLKFPRKFPQIIVLTSLVSTSTLSPRLVLFPFSRPPLMASRSKFWILSLKFHLIPVLLTRITLLCHVTTVARREIERSVILSKFQKRKMVELSIFHHLPRVIFF